MIKILRLLRVSVQTIIARSIYLACNKEKIILADNQLNHNYHFGGTPSLKMWSHYLYPQIMEPGSVYRTITPKLSDENDCVSFYRKDEQ